MRVFGLILLVIHFGCTRCKPEPCFTPPPPTPIRFINSLGQDLLNPNNPNSYPVNNIHLYYQDEKGTRKYEQVTVDSIPGSNTFVLANNLSWNSQNGRTFYLELSTTDVDTIYIRSDEVSKDGCTHYEVKDFRYNNSVPPLKSYADRPSAYEVTK